MSDRYIRNTLIAELGEEGQQRLLDGKVLVIGTGGLGSPACLYMAAAGVGTIGIVDGDVVDESNLNRQLLHSTRDLGRRKVESASETITALNPDVTVIKHDTLVTADNIAQIIEPYDIVLDCTDNFAAKFLINDACVLAGKPFVHASAVRVGGQIFTWLPGQDAPCYRCLFKEPPPDGAVPTSAQVGVLGISPGVLGTLQAAEAIKVLSGMGEPLLGRLLVYDGLSADFRTVPFAHNPECPICGDEPTIVHLG